MNSKQRRVRDRAHIPAYKAMLVTFRLLGGSADSAVVFAKYSQRNAFHLTYLVAVLKGARP